MVGGLVRMAALFAVFAVLAVLAACGDNAEHAPPIDAAAPLPDAGRFVECMHRGTSSVTGTGPSGSLAADRVYVQGLVAFCPDTLVLVLTPEDSLAVPYLAESGVINAEVTPGTIEGPVEWSGNFAATISLPDETAAAHGTVQVQLATPGFPPTTRVRATAQFDDGDWHFTATVDAPYCLVTTCL